MLITEFRIPMPNTNEEYRIGQLYSVAVMSKEETSNGEGIEVLKNEPFENEMGKGQYTYKIYHIGKKVPEWAQKLIPAKMLDFHEEAWNAFPYCKTVVTCPFMGEKYLMRITSMHKEDSGQTENIHNLDAEQLKKRKVKYLDIVNDKVDKYKKEDDPKLYKPTKVNRGQLGADWTKSTTPIMTCYKLVEVKAAIFGIQSKIEAKILEIQAQIFLNLHRKLYCRTDEWITMTIEDIRQIEDKIQAELAESFKKKAAPVKGAPAKPGSVQKATPGSIAKPTPGAVTKAATPSSATPSPSTATPTATSTGSEELAVSEEALKEIEQALEKESIQE